MHSARLRPLSRLPESSPLVPFPLKENRQQSARDVERLCSTTFKYIHSRVLCLPYLPKNFADPVNCSSALILLAESTSSAEATKKNDPNLQGREFDFLFMTILRLPIRYAKSMLPRRMRKLKDIVEWRVNERLTSAAIENLSSRDSIAHCACDNNYLLLRAS